MQNKTLPFINDSAAWHHDFSAQAEELLHTGALKQLDKDRPYVWKLKVPGYATSVIKYQTAEIAEQHMQANALERGFGMSCLPMRRVQGIDVPAALNGKMESETGLTDAVLMPFVPGGSLMKILLTSSRKEFKRLSLAAAQHNLVASTIMGDADAHHGNVLCSAERDAVFTPDRGHELKALFRSHVGALYDFYTAKKMPTQTIYKYFEHAGLSHTENLAQLTMYQARLQENRESLFMQGHVDESLLTVVDMRMEQLREHIEKRMAQKQTPR